MPVKQILVGICLVLIRVGLDEFRNPFFLWHIIEHLICQSSHSLMQVVAVGKKVISLCYKARCQAKI